MRDVQNHGCAEASLTGSFIMGTEKALKMGLGASVVFGPCIPAKILSNNVIVAACNNRSNMTNLARTSGILEKRIALYEKIILRIDAQWIYVSISSRILSDRAVISFT
jgi:hypothetical protein